MMYNKIVRDCFFNPQHAGSLDLSLSRTAFFSTAEFSQDTVIELYMHCDELYTVHSMRFRSNGNPYVIAALEWLCRQSVGNNLNQLNCDFGGLSKVLEIPFNQSPLLLQVQDVYKELLSLMNNGKGES